MEPKELYTRNRLARAKELAAEESKFRLVGTARLLLVLGGLGGMLTIVFAHAASSWWNLVGACVAAFVALLVVHGRVDRKRLRARAGLSYFDRGLARLGGDHSGSREGGAFAKDDHPFAADLDVFGRASLFQRTSVAATRFGEEALASWLSAPAESAAVVTERQQAARELAKHPELREQLAVLGATLGESHDPAPMLAWIEDASGALPAWSWRVLGVVVPTVVLGAMIIGRGRGWPTSFALGPYGLSVLLGLGMRGRTSPVVAAVTSRESSLAAYGELFALVEHAKLESPLLARIQARVKASKEGTGAATAEMRKLGAIVGFADGLSNEVFRLLVAPMFFFEPLIVLALDGWRRRNAKSVRQWLLALGELEALASFATMAFEDATLSWPDVGDAIRFEATALGHPLINRSKRVANDVSLPGPSTALVITGSNMSGKSTLMRAMGANVVLALAGAPVCATKMQVGMLRVATSMRVADSLAESTSRFYAELKKLKLVVEMAKKGEGVFFLLDEILHGTNSRERLIGARALVRDLLAKGALGAVSTHDLGLSDLESELPGKARNVHFEEQVEGDVMTFDYKLRDGVVKSSNALRLMKIVGLDIGEG